MSGWLPIFDTINGVRGEVNVQVKVELFSDHNKFRQSSCGVQFFYSKSLQVQCTLPEYNSCILISPSNTHIWMLCLFSAPNVPEGYRAQYINGFVEELVVNDDPEYQWIDKIRTPRASNEARSKLMQKLCKA